MRHEHGFMEYTLPGAGHKKRAWRPLLLAVFIPVLLVSCRSPFSKNLLGETESACTGAGAEVLDNRDSKEFASLSEDVFRAVVSSDSLTLNYSVAHPEKFGINTFPDGFQAFTYEELAESSLGSENLLSSLQGLDRGKLSGQQKILYDILEDKLEADIEGEKYLAFSEPLNAVTGIQAQLPLLLAEFRMDDKNDLEQYFALLRSIPRYFRSIIALEQRKKELGTLSCSGTLSRVLNQCEQYLRGDGTRILTETFSKKISSASFLADEEKKEALKRNERMVRKKVVPAYEKLMSGIAELLPFAGTDGSLSGYALGQGYYEYLVRTVTGSKRTVKELGALLKKQLDASRDALLGYAGKDPSLFTSCQNYAGKFASPEQILESLEKSASSDFPVCENLSYTVKNVEKTLEDFLSPAMYLTPPIDDFRENVIYINTSRKYDRSSLFNTLAHEGYPGHLLQSCYARAQSLPVLRYALDCGGYTEGWATYAEIYSYKYTGASKDEIGILRNNAIAMLCLYGLCDIGVHADGWGEKELSGFLAPYGTWDVPAVRRLYEAVVDEPASYLKYSAGYLEFTLLKDFFREKSGDAYSEKVFHTFVLETGPAPFDILEKCALEFLQTAGGAPLCAAAKKEAAFQRSTK